RSKRDWSSDVCSSDLITVDLNAPHAVAFRAIYQVFAGVLFVSGGGESVAVIFDHKDDRQIPNSSQIHRFMKFSFAGSSIPAKTRSEERRVGKETVAAR